MDRRIWDISQPIRPGIPVWPGDTDYGLERSWAIGPGCPVNVSRITMSTHTGTHADAPLHYDADGAAAAELDLSRYIGPAQLLHMPAGLTAVGVAALEGRVKAGVSRLLLKTYAAFPIERWDADFTVMEAAAIDWLAARGVALIGVDAPSLDPQSSKTLDAHMEVRRHGMGILEGLVLDGVPEGMYELIALPLKLTGADAAPVRAILRELA